MYEDIFAVIDLSRWSLGTSVIALIFVFAEPLANWWNKRTYEKDTSKFEKVMNRKKAFNSIALVFVVLSTVLALWHGQRSTQKMEDRLSSIDNSIRKLVDSVADANGKMDSIGEINSRIATIEKYLWADGSKGLREDGGPPSPTSGPSVNERFDQIELVQKNLTDKLLKGLRDNKEEIDELKRQIITMEKQIRSELEEARAETRLIIGRMAAGA